MHLNSWELVDAWKLRGSQATLYLDTFIPSERYKVTLGVHRYQQYFEYSSSGPGSHSSQSSSGGTTIHFVLNGMSFDLSAWSPPDQRDCGGGDSRVIEFELNKNDGLVALNGSKENQPIPCFSGMEKTMLKNQIVFTSMALESAYSSTESRSALIEPNEFIIDFIKIASIDSLR